MLTAMKLEEALRSADRCHFFFFFFLPSELCQNEPVAAGMDLKRIILQVHVQRNISWFMAPLLTMVAGSRGWRMLWSAAGQRPGVGGGWRGAHKASLCMCPSRICCTHGSHRRKLKRTFNVKGRQRVAVVNSGPRVVCGGWTCFLFGSRAEGL